MDSIFLKMKQIKNILPVCGGFAISNKTVPVSRSLILNLVKSISYTLASGEHK